jgi:hypothetical protein
MHGTDVEQSNRREVYDSIISGFCHGVNEIFAVLGYCTALIGCSLSKFWDRLLVSSSRGLIGCHDTLVTNYQSTLHNNPRRA